MQNRSGDHPPLLWHADVTLYIMDFQVYTVPLQSQVSWIDYYRFILDFFPTFAKDLKVKQTKWLQVSLSNALISDYHGEYSKT